MSEIKLSKYSKLQLWKITGELRGIAIIGVLVSHSSCFAVLLYKLWIGNLEIVNINTFFNWKSIMPFWSFIHEITRFSVPLFLFLSGVFMANFKKSWRTVWAMSKKILIPLIVWSFFGWFYEAIVHENMWSIGKFLLLMVKGEVQFGFFYIPLMIQFYIISIWLVDLIKKHPIISLMGSLLIQIIYSINNYLAVLTHSGIIDLAIYFQIIPDVFFPSFIFFFSFGILAAQNMKKLRALFDSYGQYLTPMIIITSLLMFFEHGFLLNLVNTQSNEISVINLFRALAPWKISTGIFSFVAILWIIKIKFNWKKKSKILNRLGSNSFSIYVLHGAIFTFFLDVQYKLIQHSLVAYCFFFLLIAFAIGIPLLLDRIVGKKQPFLSNLIGTN